MDSHHDRGKLLSAKILPFQTRGQREAAEQEEQAESIRQSVAGIRKMFTDEEVDEIKRDLEGDEEPAGQE